MKKWQKNPWAVPTCIPPYDVVEFDDYGKKIYAHSYRKFEDAWARFQKEPITSKGWIEFRRINKADADMTTTFIHNNKGMENVVEWRNLDKVGRVKI